MATSDPQPTNQSEELVAYLDGELDAEASRQVEQRAACDPQSRQTLEAFDRTWRLLDDLEAPAVGDDFARTTMEMVALAAEKDAVKLHTELPRQHRRRWLVAAVGLLAAAAASFVGVSLLLPDPNAQLLQDMPIAENLEQYRQVDSFEFLERLNQEKLFAEEADDGT